MSFANKNSLVALSSLATEQGARKRINETPDFLHTSRIKNSLVALSSLATEQGARKRINETQFVASVAPRETECRIILEEDK